MLNIINQYKEYQNAIYHFLNISSIIKAIIFYHNYILLVTVEIILKNNLKTLFIIIIILNSFDDKCAHKLHCTGKIII